MIDPGIVGNKGVAMKLTLINKENLVDNVWAFRFEPETPLRWTPGQYMRVEIPHEQPDTEGTKRWFTISSAPYEGFLQITTRVTLSTFKKALSGLAVGDKIELIEEPHGDFVWEDIALPKVFVAGGIGVTPFHSILKQRFYDGNNLPVTLVYGGRNQKLPFEKELQEWSEADSSLQVKYVLGEPLTAQKIAEVVPGLNGSLVYVSGPEPMVQALGQQLKGAGLPEAQLKTDEFPNYNETNY